MMDDIPDYRCQGMIFNQVDLVKLEKVTFENIEGEPLVLQDVKKGVIEDAIKENNR